MATWEFGRRGPGEMGRPAGGSFPARGDRKELKFIVMPRRCNPRGSLSRACALVCVWLFEGDVAFKSREMGPSGSQETARAGRVNCRLGPLRATVERRLAY